MARYYYRPNHPKASANGFVSEEDVGESLAPRALDAPIMAGRFFENQSYTADGKTYDLGSRQKHRNFMKEMGWTMADDFKGQWAKAEERRAAVKEGRMPSKTRREVLGRALYEKHKP